MGSQSCIQNNNDNISICLHFSDGSVGNIVYVANGDKSLSKEYIEIFSGGKVGIINDFRSGIVYFNNQSKKISISGKGHREEVLKFIESVKNTGIDPIPAESILYTTITTFKIVDSLLTGLPQTIEL